MCRNNNIMLGMKVIIQNLLRLMLLRVVTISIEYITIEKLYKIKIKEKQFNEQQEKILKSIYSDLNFYPKIVYNNRKCIIGTYFSDNLYTTSNALTYFREWNEHKRILSSYNICHPSRGIHNIHTHYHNYNIE